MASLRSCGIALITASRKPTRTSTVMARPSTTMTPIASGQLSRSAPNSEEPRKGLTPRPAAGADRVPAVEPHRDRGHGGHERGDRQQLIEGELDTAGRGDRAPGS